MQPLTIKRTIMNDRHTAVYIQTKHGGQNEISDS